VCATSDLDSDHRADAGWVSKAERDRTHTSNARVTRVTHVTRTPGQVGPKDLHSLKLLRSNQWKSRVSLRSGTHSAVGRARCRDDNRRPGCEQVAFRPQYARGGNERRAAD